MFSLALDFSHAFLTLAPPSSYALNLKALIKVSKVSWISQLSYEILRSSFERKFDKTNFISPKRTPPKSPHRLGLRRTAFSYLSSPFERKLVCITIFLWLNSLRKKLQIVKRLQKYLVRSSYYSQNLFSIYSVLLPSVCFDFHICVCKVINFRYWNHMTALLKYIHILS